MWSYNKLLRGPKMDQQCVDKPSLRYGAQQNFAESNPIYEDRGTAVTSRQMFKKGARHVAFHAAT